MDKTSRIMPKWMQIKNDADRPIDHIKSHEFNSFKTVINILLTHCKQKKKTVIMVDKFQDNKSVFSIGDYRHKLHTKEQAETYNSSVSQKPKNFLLWDDGLNYNPKVKRDSSFVPKHKQQQLSYNLSAVKTN